MPVARAEDVSVSIILATSLYTIYDSLAASIFRLSTCYRSLKSYTICVVPTYLYINENMGRRLISISKNVSLFTI